MDFIMNFILGKFAVVFVGLLLIGYGYLKYNEKKRKEKECDKVIGKIVSYERDKENQGYGRYIYEYEYRERKYHSAFDKTFFKGKKQKVEKQFGKKELLYCERKNPFNISKVYDYTSMISILGGILVIILGILFV